MEAGGIHLERLLVGGHLPRELVAVPSNSNSRLHTSPVSHDNLNWKDADERIQLVTWRTGQGQLHSIGRWASHDLVYGR
jgi:hypothetical protein